MSYSGSGNTGGSAALQMLAAPGATTAACSRMRSIPMLQPELFRGVLTRRVFAFLIDLVVLSVPVILGYLFIAVFGLITLGLGWALFWLAWPATIVWAIVYYGASLGGPHSATVGMRVMDLELRTWYGAPGYFVLGAMHAVLFWVSISFLTPLVLLVGLFNGRRRLLHDIVLGTVVINSSVRTQVRAAGAQLTERFSANRLTVSLRGAMLGPVRLDQDQGRTSVRDRYLLSPESAMFVFRRPDDPT